MHVYNQQAAATRQKFLDAAFELFTRQGYRSTSMNEIAKHAGGSRANLYLHFRNKPDIVLARMQDMEPHFTAPFRELFASPPVNEDGVQVWLGSMKELWDDYLVEFSTIDQAMGQDEGVAAEWWAMVHRVANSFPELSTNPERRMHFITLWMGLDRTFQMVFGHGHTEDASVVMDSLAHQWLALFTKWE